ncbi:endo-1,4-beta-xylanase [Polaribacter sp. 11A2H]|uniref:endo-1,4-beta-xylanase n=1 Tax=Polaribacter sp. 11A2H TaxID=2687290 RepID=UPI0014080746|nr:endo-1,4-beta-xylanase [Polaribacter sp. 11A2H]
MIKQIKSILICAAVCFLSCKELKKEAAQEKEVTQEKEEIKASLKSTFNSDFLIGAAINSAHIKETDSIGVALINREFNSITPENDLKWEGIHPKENEYFFDIADAYVAFGQKNNLYTIGHTLLWHSQLSPYVSKITKKEDLENHIKTHINTIAGRYKGKINAWDVVNEALNEDGSPRTSHFYNVFKGESYLELAFKTASEAAPDAKLVYNDYNLWKPEKRKGVIRIVKNLQEKGIKIDGVGMQAHWSLDGPSIEDIENSILAYSELGVKVSFTELDITVLKKPKGLNGAAIEQNYDRYKNDPIFNPYKDGLTEEAKQKLATRYEAVFNLFLKHKDKIERVTFWGVNDGNSWLNDWPIKGRTNYPLLFDRNNQPKDVYKNVISIKK